jgi:hypothetical protein
MEMALVLAPPSECVPTLLRFLRRAPVGRTGTSLAPSTERGARAAVGLSGISIKDAGLRENERYVLLHSVLAHPLIPLFLFSLGAPDSHPPALGVTFVPAPLDSRRHPFLADGRLLCLPVPFVGFLRFRPLALECSA